MSGFESLGFFLAGVRPLTHWAAFWRGCGKFRLLCISTERSHWALFGCRFFWTRCVRATLARRKRDMHAKKAHDQLKRHYMHEALPDWAPFCCRVDQLTSKMFEQFSLYSIMSLKTAVVRFIMTSFRCVSVVSFYLLALHYNTAAIIAAVDTIYCRLSLEQQNFETKRYSIFWFSLYN